MMAEAPHMDVPAAMKFGERVVDAENAADPFGEQEGGDKDREQR